MTEMFPEHETRTRELLPSNHHRNQFETYCAVRQVFWAKYSYCLDVKDIHKIGEALSSYKLDEAKLLRELNTLVREGVLRRRGPRSKLYEVNY